MNCSPTITAEEFKAVHNGLCDLRHAIHRLEGVIAPELLGLLQGARDRIRSGLDGAYKQDSEAFERKYAHYRKVAEELGLQTAWSIYDVDNLSDRHPFEGALKVVYEDHWGDKPVSCSVNGLTWAALWVAANACIRDSGDGHHTFIESFRASLDDPRTLILNTGS